MKIVFHPGEKHWSGNPCCDEMANLMDSYCVNFQPSGLRLEVPESFNCTMFVGPTEDDWYFKFKKIGYMKVCPFCGEKIEVEVEKDEES